ncbi:MAG: hypothetical protein KTR32_05060 [Granulosicoccus sp.]|nr:hypothetical protein [Granulosicoccus sp.]
MQVFRPLRAVLLAVAVLTLSGCEAVPPGKVAQWLETNSTSGAIDDDFSASHYELIATDIVSAMIQVREFNPLTTTMQYSNPRGQFGQLLIEKLRVAGYGLQEVGADQGEFYIAYQTREIENNRGEIRDFIVDIAGIEIRREYNVQSGSVVPASLMYISGSSSLENIILNESIFLQQGNELEFESGVELELPDSTVVASATRNVGLEGTVAVGGRDAIRDARNNLLGRSNEEILLQKPQYNDLQRALIRFEDNSLNVGRKNKAIVSRVLEGFEPQSDALFLTSCGGDTGTQSQASDRSARIKEELVLSGVPVDLIVEEGCIADQYPNRQVESRTVVLMHSRVDETRGVTSARAPVEFPNKPLAMTIPYGAGGATDYQARIVTMVASEEKYLGQPVLIINKPGEGGRAGWSWFAETASDTGYDLATYNVPHFIAQSIKFETPYNIDTLEPIGNFGADPAVLVTPKNSGLQSVADLVRYARSNPGELTVSGAGKFVGHHIALLQLEKSAGITTTYVTDKGGAAALEQVVTGEVMAGFNNMSDAFRRRDELQILAIADIERNEILAEVPTFLELGLDIDNSSVNYRGFMVPKGTPQAIIDRLAAVSKEMFEDDIVVNRMKEGGAPLKVMSRNEVIGMWQERQSYLTELLRGL